MSINETVDDNLTVEIPGIPGQEVTPEIEVTPEPEQQVTSLFGLANQANQNLETTEINDGEDPYGFYVYIRTKYRLKGELPTAVKRVVTNLNSYITEMQPNVPLEKDVLTSNQRKLWNTFVLALNTTPADSSMCIDIILHAFEKHFNSVFNERMIWRGLRDVKLSAGDSKSFQFVGTLFINTARAMMAAPDGRKPTKRALASTNLREVVASLSSEVAQMNLTAYYSSN